MLNHWKIFKWFEKNVNDQFKFFLQFQNITSVLRRKTFIGLSCYTKNNVWNHVKWSDDILNDFWNGKFKLFLKFLKSCLK